ncbi:MAG: transglutaminase domain-containing protein [Candidatus Nanopelagicales bacterium]
MAAQIDYSAPGIFTDLNGVDLVALRSLADDPVEICFPVHNLVIQPDDAKPLNLDPERFEENQIRPVSKLVQRLLTLDPTPLAIAREPDKRVVGTCRHFAVLSCALLRRAGVAARVRCGFATYFQPGQALDHWITEYWHEHTARWVRIDTEILGQQVLARPQDLAPGEFLTGGEAWSAFRRGVIDPATFGVHGTDNWGAAEIRGNAVKDLAALNKVEVLPWDEWGRMTHAYAGKTGSDYDELLDTVADVCAEGEPSAIAALYTREELTVPKELLS